MHLKKHMGGGGLRSGLLAMVALKERDIDFLDSSSAGVGSSGTEPTSGPRGAGS